MGKRLVLVGGGHAHMLTLANLNTFVEKGHQVTVIGPSVHHYYSGMGPGMLGTTYGPEEIRFRTRHVVEKQGGYFVLDSVTRIDPEKKIVLLASGGTVPYDVLSCNSGSYVPQDIITKKSDALFSVKPIEKLLAAQARIIELCSQKRISIGIVGGGPSAAEVAGNIWQLVGKQGGQSPAITIVAGRRFMARVPDSVRNKTAQILIGRDIEILEGDYAKEVRGNELILQSGKDFRFDIIFMTLGIKPSPMFAQSGLPTGPDGGLLVNKYLQSNQYPELFGGGDCIYFQDRPLDKVGVYAVRENPILLHNLTAALAGKPLRPFVPQAKYLLIFNLGGGLGILHKGWLHFNGRLAFLVKDYIDRKFIRTFQAIEQ